MTPVTPDNVRSIRPAGGLAARAIGTVAGRRVPRGRPARHAADLGSHLAIERPRAAITAIARAIGHPTATQRPSTIAPPGRPQPVHAAGVAQQRGIGQLSPQPGPRRRRPGAEAGRPRRRRSLVVPHLLVVHDAHHGGRHAEAQHLPERRAGGADHQVGVRPATSRRSSARSPRAAGRRPTATAASGRAQSGAARRRWRRTAAPVAASARITSGAAPNGIGAAEVRDDPRRPVRRQWAARAAAAARTSSRRST